MIQKLFLFLGIFAALAINSTAQINNFQNSIAPNVVAEDIFSRPRLAEEKVAEVKAAVIVNVASVERIAFQLLNQKRGELGLKPLMWSDELERVARQHSQSMADFKFFSHRGRDGKMVSDRADVMGVGNWRAIGENIAYNRGYSDPIEKAVELWLGSPSHRRNLLDENWKESAVGIAIAADGSYYLTQVFMRK